MIEFGSKNEYISKEIFGGDSNLKTEIKYRNGDIHRTYVDGTEITTTGKSYIVKTPNGETYITNEKPTVIYRRGGSQSSSVDSQSTRFDDVSKDGGMSSNNCKDIKEVSDGINKNPNVDVIPKSDDGGVHSYFGPESDRISKTVLPDGQIETKFKNGDVHTIYLDGREVMKYGSESDYSAKIMYPDGKTGVRFKNGDLQTIYPDGRVVIKYNEGPVRYIDDNGGVKKVSYRDGSEKISFKSGEIESIKINGKKSNNNL